MKSMAILSKSKLPKWIYVFVISFFCMIIFVPTSTAEEKAHPIKVVAVNGVHFRIIKIPAGNFMMGSPLNEEGRDEDEGPQHEVRLNSFWMGETEVTQDLWKAVMGENPSKFSDCGEKCPVEQVSWNDVQKFIDKLNQIDKMNRFRLPTEAEWEYACRAGTTSRFSFGEDDSFWHILEYACYNDISPHPVAQKKPNTFGLYDMHGNVWEWCQDWYEETYYSHSKVHNPKGPQTGEYRVIRGGSWLNAADNLRSSDRGRHEPDARHYRFLGFRLAMDQIN